MPFRYTSGRDSRFRAANAPGVWYGADSLQTVCAVVAYWRYRITLSWTLQDWAKRWEIGISAHPFSRKREGLSHRLAIASMDCQCLTRDRPARLLSNTSPGSGSTPPWRGVYSLQLSASARRCVRRRARARGFEPHQTKPPPRLDLPRDPQPIVVHQPAVFGELQLGFLRARVRIERQVQV